MITTVLKRRHHSHQQTHGPFPCIWHEVKKYFYHLDAVIYPSTPKPKPLTRLLTRLLARLLTLPKLFD